MSGHGGLLAFGGGHAQTVMSSAGIPDLVPARIAMETGCGSNFHPVTGSLAVMPWNSDPSYTDVERAMP
jgi:hypothetical protein